VLSILLATSVPPKISRKHPDGVDIGIQYQQHCINTWAEAGWKVVSLNPAAEVEKVSAMYDGLAISPLRRDSHAVYGRPLIWMSDVLDFLAASDAEVVGIVNSDICLQISPAEAEALAEMATAHMMAYNRTEIAHIHQETGPLYRYGFDLYLFPKSAIPRLRMDGLALGAPWWDYWMLLNSLLESLPVRVVQGDGARHLTHPNNWNVRSWEIAAQIVARRVREYRIERRAGHDNNSIDPSSEFFASFADDLIGSLRFDTKANFLGNSLNHGFGTILGLFIVRLLERSACRFA